MTFTTITDFENFLAKWNNDFLVKHFEVIYAGGSDRKFFRVYTNKGIFILLDSKSQSIKDFLKIQYLLFQIKIPVPKIYYFSELDNSLLMEDCGKLSFYEFVKTDKGLHIKLYETILTKLIQMQFEGKDFTLKNQIEIDNFGLRDFLWESDYFRKYFLLNFLNLEINESKFNFEASLLAESCSKLDKFFMHRDFQSQNILLRATEVKTSNIVFIDFQSSKIGTNYYDLASFLLDPYIAFNEDLFWHLLNFYREKVTEKYKFDFCNKSFFYVSMQRLMQVLGAFSYLSLEKKKLQFQKYFPQAIRNFKFVQNHVKEFDYLKKIVADIEQKIQKNKELQ